MCKYYIKEILTLADFNTKVIRNVCLRRKRQDLTRRRHLYSAKACDRLGKVPEGNTVL